MAEEKKHRIIKPWDFAEALVASGILTKEQVNRTTRIVIDCNPNAGVIIYMNQIADSRLLDVAQTLDGIQVTHRDAELTKQLEGLLADAEKPIDQILIGLGYIQDTYGKVWFIAECQDCTPVLKQPFEIQGQRDNFANEHVSATGHNVHTWQEDQNHNRIQEG